MKKTLLVLALASFALAGCDKPLPQDPPPAQKQGETSVVEHSEAVSKTVDNAHNARNALDWNGTYTGILPCADCEGIKTELVVNDDGTYTLTEMYLGEEGATFEREGTFNWNAEGNTIAIPGVSDNAIKYFVGENQLFRLDRDGNRVSGDLATHYILKKQ